MHFINIIKYDYISLAEAASGTSYSGDYLRLRARQGKLKARKINGLWYTTENWLRRYNQLCKKGNQLGLNRPQVIFLFFQPIFSFNNFLNHQFDLLVYRLSVLFGYFSFIYNKKIRLANRAKVRNIDTYILNQVKIFGVFLFAFLTIGSIFTVNNHNHYSKMYGSYITEVRSAFRDLSLDFNQQYSINKKTQKLYSNYNAKSESAARTLAGIQVTLGFYIARSVLPVAHTLKIKLANFEKKYTFLNYSKEVLLFWEEVSNIRGLNNPNYTFQNIQNQYYRLVARVIKIPIIVRSYKQQANLMNNDIRPRVLGESDFMGRFPIIKNVPPLPRVKVINNFFLKLVD